MRFISLWVNTAFSTKYGSIFITASWMGSTTRCILLKEANPGLLPQELPPLHQLPETVREESAKEERRWFQVSAFEWRADWQSTLICAAQWRGAVCLDATPSVSSSLIWASVCASQTPAWRDALQSPLAAWGSHNCACPFRLTLFYSKVKL